MFFFNKQTDYFYIITDADKSIVGELHKEKDGWNLYSVDGKKMHVSLLRKIVRLIDNLYYKDESYDH